MKRLNNFIKDQEVRPLTSRQCNTLSGGSWSDNKKGKKKKKKKKKKKDGGLEDLGAIQIDPETVLVAEFQLHFKDPNDPPSQCPHM